ncbi:unnamed protein product [Chilo suppressalis]|uniref:BED-type domain-containing protein n=1 Tax=Chilo suppressalis TaxID=168631 RepID=A0ABN8BF10_CHISP|nr:unnamed protein product [Chilo suppressalis]
MSDEDSNCSSPSNESLSYRSKSKFEEFFEKNHASQTALFKLCQHKKVEIKMKNRNTSGLMKHLISFHKKESQIFLPVKPKLSGGSFLVTAGRSGQSENSSDNITIATVDWVVKKYLPLTFFDDEATQLPPHFDSDNQHFRCFAHILNLGVQNLLKTLALHCETNTNAQEKQYEDYADEIEEDEKYAPNIADSSTAVTKLRSISSKVKRSEIVKKKFQYCS